MKRQAIKWAPLALIILTVAGLMIMGCQAPVSLGKTGTVRLQFNTSMAQSILPPISMDVVEYLVSGAGPQGSTYGPELFTGSATIEDLLPGSWSWTVVGRNAAHNDIGEGSGACSVVIGQTAVCNITVAEYESPDGSFLLDLAWEPDIVRAPVWTGSLKDYAAAVTDLAFTVNEAACTAQSLADPLHVGWYAMVVQLFDAPTGIDGSEVLSTGAAAAVRIAAGRQTHGDLFLHAVQGFGRVDLQITPDFHDELALTPSVPFGDVALYLEVPMAFSVTADETCTAIYYLRGQQVGVDGFTALAENQLEGEAYRLDVVAFNTDGSRAASGTWRLTNTGILGTVSAIFTWNGQGGGQYFLRYYNPDDSYSEIAITATNGPNSYEIMLPGAGTYRFAILYPSYGLTEFWQEAGTLAAATPVAVALGPPLALNFGEITNH